MSAPQIYIFSAITADYRTVTFPVKSGEKVTVYALSGSKTDVRTLLFVNENGEQAASVDVPPYTGGKIEIGSFKASANGTLLAYSKSGGIYIFCIKVE